MIKVLSLGQVGFRLEFSEIVIYIDPYLSDSVREKEDPEIARLKPIPIDPTSITDADWVLITHEHRDHCDIDTLLPISKSSPQCRFIGPEPVCKLLELSGIDKTKLIIARKPGFPFTLNKGLIIHVLPSAHPDIESLSDGGWRCVGYIIDYNGKKIYHAGDTSLVGEVIEQVNVVGDIYMAMLPVNERNFMREQRGIIGNMSVREAFYFAETMKANIVVPTHWDMFAQNQVYREEIEIIYEMMKPSFEIVFDPHVF